MVLRYKTECAEQGMVEQLVGEIRCVLFLQIKKA